MRTCHNVVSACDNIQGANGDMPADLSGIIEFVCNARNGCRNDCSVYIEYISTTQVLTYGNETYQELREIYTGIGQP